MSTENDGNFLVNGSKRRLPAGAYCAIGCIAMFVTMLIEAAVSSYNCQEGRPEQYAEGDVCGLGDMITFFPIILGIMILFIILASTLGAKQKSSPGQFIKQRPITPAEPANTGAEELLADVENPAFLQEPERSETVPAPAPPAKERYCAFCGFELPSDFGPKFCPNCGAKISV